VALGNGEASASEQPLNRGPGFWSTASRRNTDRRKIHRSQTFSVADGREAVGRVELIDGSYIAISPTGEIVDKFTTLLAATRALPQRRAR
jgi:hypothetical protein